MVNLHVREHIERCIELYGQPIDSEFKRKVDLSSYEQMRADLMIALGMLMAGDSAALKTAGGEG